MCMHLLDQQLAAGLKGDFKKGWRIAKQLPKDCPRSMFNKGWYMLRRGHLLEGHKLMDAGRGINVFGNRHIGSTAPLWRGERNCTVLLNIEGGLGDQINAVRWAKVIQEMDNRVIVSCTDHLIPLFQTVEGIDYIVAHEDALTVDHDHWFPSMSIAVVLELEWADIDGGLYIPGKGTGDKIGLRWSGNPEFEHQQHRTFDAELLFNSVKGHGEFISLQRDEGAELRPDWVREVPVNTWLETVEALGDCKLVITSDTSIAHLSGAMGIETWMITPILPYFMWALPGKKTPYYDSLTLFRQTKYGRWSNVFARIEKELAALQ